MSKVDLKTSFRTQLRLRWIVASLAAAAAWLVLSPSLDRRSGLGLDLSQLSPAVISSLEDVPHRFDFVDREDSVALCPGASCPLNDGVSGKVLRYERKVSSNLATMITTEGWNRTLYMAWAIKVPNFVTHAGDEVAFDFYGIRGRSWRFFVNGQEQASGFGSTELPPIVFKSPSTAGEPMTLGFEVDVGNALAPGIVHIGQVFLSQPESAAKFRLVYRGLDRAAVLPTATGFTLLGLLAALGCFFTPFFKEILAFSFCVTIFNLRLLSINNLVPFQSLPGVDFVTFDVVVRSLLFSTMWVFWALYFRVKTHLRWIPASVYAVVAGCCYAAGLTGVGLESLVFYVKTIDLQQALVFFGAAFFAFNTWRATYKSAWARFRTYTAALIFISALILGVSFVVRAAVNANSMTWETYRIYEPLFFVANHAVRIFILGQGILLALEWALIVRDRQQVLQRFGQVVDPRMVNDIIRGREGTSRKVDNVVALFIDLRSFTKICDSYSADIVTKTLNDYLGVVTEAVRLRGGVVDKFAGDSVLATWGVPSPGVDDPISALKAALSMRLAIIELNERRRSTGLFPIQVGIGVQIGEAIFGAVGSGLRVDYTVIGSTVNTAARIQGLTKIYRCDILVTRQFYESVKDYCLADNLGPKEIRGLSRPVELLKVIGVSMSPGGNVLIGDKTLEEAVATRKPGLVSQTPPNVVIFDHTKSASDSSSMKSSEDKAA